MLKRRLIALTLIISILGFNLEVLAAEYRYPDFGYEFLGNDKHENYNRKMFNFNLKLNKYVIKPVHILWTAIVPQYGIDRIYGISNNVEYPVRLVSSLVQRDFKNAGRETARFLVNSTVGLGGMYDPAKRFLNLQKSTDNMDKALARCNVKPGMYFIAPVINFTTVRGLFGRVLDAALNPSTYIGTPVLAAIKAALVINKTSYVQSVIKLLETNFADPYMMTKIAFGVDGYIKKNNYDRVDVISQMKSENNVQPKKLFSSKPSKTKLTVSAKIIQNGETDSANTNIDGKGKQVVQYGNGISTPEIVHLENYAPQTPVVDSMRTTLFALPEAKNSMWNEMSPWNRSFANRIKTSSVTVFEGRQEYNFRYLLQKNKNAPLAVIYPSTGDGINANHPTMFAKIFYDAGYSVVIQGNPFQWEFVKSMPANYRPGVPSRDANMMRITTKKIVTKLQDKYGHKFEDKVILGTSLAALDILYMAEQESKTNTLGKFKVIAICPPVDLMYSINLLDKYAEEWADYGEDLKEKVALASAKLVKLYQEKDNLDFDINRMPFDEDEAKLFTSFVMHEKLANVIFAVENAPTNKKSDVYDIINKTGYSDYVDKYIISDPELAKTLIERGFGLKAISKYLETANNYKIYHTKNDYLITEAQLKQLKNMAKKNLVIFDNGSHMGFLYRPEFISNLQQTIETMKG